MVQHDLRICRTALTLLLILSSAASYAGNFNLGKTKRVLTEVIESALQERGTPSVSIALVKDDKIVWKAAFGYSNVRTKTLATPDTIYSTGSTFKSVTAAALVQLQEQGKLSLSDPVNRHLKNSKVQDRLQSEKPVNIEHILSHWSGLTAGARTQPIWGRVLPKTLNEFTAELYSIRAPEEKWEYNNFAYGMAGLLIEDISGQEYEEYMLEHILKPLGVTTPHPVYPSAEMVEMMALPYMPGGDRGKPRAVSQVHFDVYPAGDIYLTAEDMARFLGANLNGGVFNGNRILSEESVKAMHQVRFGGNYALGIWIKEDERGHRIIEHGGSIPGQTSLMLGDLDAKVGVYFMSNSGGSSEIGKAAIALLRGEDYTPPAKKSDIQIDRKILDRYTGTYIGDYGTTFIITRDGTDLLLSDGKSGVWKLPAESENSFYFARYDGTMSFQNNENGVVDGLTIEFGDNKISARKKK